ncbi:MAG TPA: 2-phosphosulfolactate phosphatase [Anaerolineaceae bacterium]
MNFSHVTLETCHKASGVVVVIDVVRAFTTAAVAFSRGAESILLVSEVTEALALRQRFPFARLMGEVNGLPIPVFEYGNSPSALAAEDLSGCLLIQRTSAGTQGMVRSRAAHVLLAGSFSCALATVDYIRRSAADSVTFVVTGKRPGDSGDEDAACAEYLERLLVDGSADPAPYLRRVFAADTVRKFLDENEPDFPRQDLDYCTAANRFDFAMLASRQDGLLRLKPVWVC